MKVKSYNVIPLKIQSHCDVCGTALKVRHTLSCIKGGLVIARHKKERDELIYLSWPAFTSASVCSETLINQGRTISENDIRQVSDKDKETCGGVVIWGLWYQQDEAIIDVKLRDADTDSYNNEPMAEVMARWETTKKYKHGRHCQDQGKHFSPFVIFVDGMLGRASLVLLAQLSWIVAEKIHKPI